MGIRSRTLPTLDDTDVRLLRVFQAVVRQQGFASAQSELGLAAATISNHIASLESRLGVRLCNRGRKGFSLTAEGARIHEASLTLFRSIENFSSVVGTVRGELSGSVQFATVDAMYTNRELPLVGALAAFTRAAPGVSLQIDIASPQDLRQRLLDGRYQLILTPLDNPHPSIDATELLHEEQMLYCGRKHELFAVPERRLEERLRTPQRYAARSYASDLVPPGGLDLQVMAMTSHMESLALLILSGAYLGHLPSHYARAWVEVGQMRALLPEATSYVDRFRLAHLRAEQNRAAALLRDCILANCIARLDGRTFK